MTNNKKKINRERLQEIADIVGDLKLMEMMFWHMFDDLSIKNQEKYIKWAEQIKDEN